jgi:hypothetical protein
MTDIPKNTESTCVELAQFSNFEEGLIVETSLRKIKSVKKYEFVIITSGYQSLLKERNRYSIDM